MPWKETDAMVEKERFIAEMLKNDRPFKRLCAEFGISEKTGYKWKNRFYAEGTTGLLEQSRASAEHPNSLPEDVVIGIVGLKQAHPYWGGKKIQALFVKTHPRLLPPSLSSVNRVLNKAGLVRKRRVKPASTDCQRLRQRILPKEVNDVWAIDFKGWWKSGGDVCEPFTVRDLASRKLLCVQLMKSKDSDAVRAVMSELFRKYGLPKVIRSDNGTPFSSTNGLLSLTKLSAWWIALGIVPDRTEKGCPGQNGSLERVHADIAREIEGKIPGGAGANQSALDAWVEEYNSVRPNEAIGMRTPDEMYRPSERKYVGDYDELEYPIGFLSRKVSGCGVITVSGVRVSISRSLAGLNVGLKPLEDNCYQVFLSDFLLGILRVDLCCFTPLEAIE